MVTTDDIGKAQLLFLLGNLCFLAKVIFSRELEVEHDIPSLFGNSELYFTYSDNGRVIFVTLAVFVCLVVTCMEWSWAEGKRIHSLSSEKPASLQPPLLPAYILRIPESTLNPANIKEHYCPAKAGCANSK
jgi:hypothetical protein